MDDQKTSKELLQIENTIINQVNSSPFLINKEEKTNLPKKTPTFKPTKSILKDRAASFLAQINQDQNNVDAIPASIEDTSDVEDESKPKIELNLLLFDSKKVNLPQELSTSSNSDSDTDSSDEESDSDTSKDDDQ